MNYCGGGNLSNTMLESIFRNINVLNTVSHVKMMYFDNSQRHYDISTSGIMVIVLDIFKYIAYHYIVLTG